jgi:hypothetical protein
MDTVKKIKLETEYVCLNPQRRGLIPPWDLMVGGFIPIRNWFCAAWILLRILFCGAWSTSESDPARSETLRIQIPQSTTTVELFQILTETKKYEKSSKIINKSGLHMVSFDGKTNYYYTISVSTLPENDKVEWA